MKKFFSSIMISLTVFGASAQTAQNITFTDIDGVTHDLYTYLDSGYTVILDFSYELCGPCQGWTEGVGHDLWETHGPEGENTLRIFFFDVEDTLVASDQDVADYTQEWGVECPVINLPGTNTFPEYPEDGYPTIYFICPDRSLSETGGYGYPFSEMEANMHFELCQGSNLNSNASLFDATVPSTHTLCDLSPLQFTPTLSVFETNVILDGGGPLSSNSFSISVFVNGQLFETQTINPGFSWFAWHQVTLDAIAVDFSDTITFVCDYPGDNFADDDTISVVIPEAVNTPISSDSSLTLEASGSSLYFDLFNAQGQSILVNQQGTQSFNLPVDSCYSMAFINANSYGATLKDANDHVIFSFEAGEYMSVPTPRLYFHVSNNPVGIPEAFKEQQPIDRYFIDVLGKAYRTTDIRSLSAGVYFEINYYQNGVVTSKKHVIK